jgi:hypothetical protein
MKKVRIAILITLVLSFLLSGVFAQKARPVQFALFNPVQVVKQDYSIHGIRLNLIYGVNEDVNGVDGGFINQTNGTQRGAQWGIVNIGKENFYGFRYGWVNLLDYHFHGMSTGGVTVNKGNVDGWVSGAVTVVLGKVQGVMSGGINVMHGDYFKGAQLGAINIINPEVVQTGNNGGVQIGLFNYATSLKGVQFGLININRSAKLKFFPIMLISGK